MLLTHAQPDARSDLVAGNGGGEKVAAGELYVAFRHRDQRRQGHCADVQHGLAVHVVKLEALDLCAVDQCRMVRGEPAIRAPNRSGPRGIEPLQRFTQDSAPFEIGAINRAAERIENEQLDALAHLGGNLLVGQPGNKFGDRARMNVVGAGVLGHSRSIYRAAVFALTASHHGQMPAMTW